MSRVISFSIGPPCTPALATILRRPASDLETYLAARPTL
jgi:hypothetical protein